MNKENKKVKKIFGCKVEIRDWLKEDEWYFVNPWEIKKLSLKEALQTINKD